MLHEGSTVALGSEHWYRSGYIRLIRKSLSENKLPKSPNQSLIIMAMGGPQEANGFFDWEKLV